MLLTILKQKKKTENYPNEVQVFLLLFSLILIYFVIHPHKKIKIENINCFFPAILLFPFSGTLEKINDVENFKKWSENFLWFSKIYDVEMVQLGDWSGFYH